MFKKTSRYWKLDDVITTDCRGDRSRCKALRRIPDVIGSFSHTVEDADRLDHLAYKYYKKPGKWWLICDANPGEPSPIALTGKGPVKRYDFALTWTGGDRQPPLAEMRSELLTRPGIERVIINDTVIYSEEPRPVPGSSETISVYVPERNLTVTVTLNETVITREEVESVIGGIDADLNVSTGVIRQVTGKSIVIPPNQAI